MSGHTAVICFRASPARAAMRGSSPVHVEAKRVVATSISCAVREGAAVAIPGVTRQAAVTMAVTSIRAARVTGPAYGRARPTSTNVPVEKPRPAWKAGARSWHSSGSALAPITKKMRSRSRRVLAVCVTPLVLAGAGCGEKPLPAKLTGGLLVRNDQHQCGNFADQDATCSWNDESVVAVDLRRSRFLVVWRRHRRADDGHLAHDEVVGQFVSRRGYRGRRVTLNPHRSTALIGSDPRRISAAYVPGLDEYVIAWDGLDHRRTAAGLSAVGRVRRARFHEDHITRARDGNVRIVDVSVGDGQDRVELYDQEARLPPHGPRLRVWDGGEGINAQILDGAGIR